MAMFVERLRASGVTVDENVLPGFDFSRATETFNLLARAETSTMATDDDYQTALGDTSQPGHRGRNARGTTLSHRDWLHLHEERLGYQREWVGYFDRYDGFLSPVAAACAQPLATGIDSVLRRTVDVNGRDIEMTDQHFWASIPTLSRLPAVTLPIGVSRDGLPAGMQLVGPAYCDLDLIAMGETLVGTARH
jgi:amidase